MAFLFMEVAENATDVVSALQHMHTNLCHTEEFKFISRDGEHEFTSHLLILAIHSSVLQDMIYGPSSCRSIKIEDVDNVAIENLIRHCYAENLVFASVYDVTETKTLADKFQILELSRICVTRFTSIDVNLSNVIFVLKTSIEFNDAIKESECLLLIKENKEAVFTSEPFQAIKFENVLEIFVKLRERDFLTEFEFLHSGIRWLLTNGNQNEGKENLMNRIDISRISLNDYLDVIVSYPEFFSNTEISCAVKIIRSSKPIGDSEELGNQLEVAETQPTVNETKLYQDAETNTGETNPTRSSDYSGDNEELGNQQVPDSRNLKELTIELHDGYPCSEGAKVVVKDGISTRSLQFLVCDELRNGLIGSMKENVYSQKDVDISYEGIYCMLRLLHDPNQRPSPLQHIEVLKAAQFFKLTNLADELILDIGNIVYYDPAFLEVLYNSSFRNRCLYLLTSKPMSLILHPNFIHCCPELIILLLDQGELKIGDETQVLFTSIFWLEARDHQRSHFRFTLLNKIAFENISTLGFKYGIKNYPNFFTDSEKESILAYKTAEGEENIRISREKLPEWYNFKSRNILPINDT